MEVTYLDLDGEGYMGVGEGYMLSVGPWQLVKGPIHS
jgi:hypothetical protein